MMLCGLLFGFSLGGAICYYYGRRDEANRLNHVIDVLCSFIVSDK